MRRIVQNGYVTHLIIDNQSPEAVALVEAILDADQAVRREGVTSAQIQSAIVAIRDAETRWCREHGFKFDHRMRTALADLASRLQHYEARHASA